MDSHTEVETANSGLLNRILAKYKECNDSIFLELAINHLQVYEKYMKLIEEKGETAFPNRLEYQKLSVAKLFIDRLHLLQFAVDSSVNGYKEYKDKLLPPADTFDLAPDLKNERRMKFLRNIEKGDILHLQLLEVSKNEPKFLVINKYNENERVVDYCIHAYFLNMSQLPEEVKVGDFVRAAVFGKLKMEGKAFSKLLVTLNNKFVPEVYKDVKLRQISKAEIPFYPEDISNYSCLTNYMDAENNSDDPQELGKCMTSLGVDAYKMYSFQESGDGVKLGKPKAIDSQTYETKKMEMSMNLIKEAESHILQKTDMKIVLQKIDKALEIYPQNDAAYAVRAQLWKHIFIRENDSSVLKAALRDCEKALDLNQYNLTATRVYLTILLCSAEIFKDENKKAKADEVMAVLNQCKEVCDVTEILRNIVTEEGQGQQQSSNTESQSAAATMDT